MSFHLWRAYPQQPFDRFACTVKFSAKADDGFEIVDFDPNVADANFLHLFAEHMRKPTAVQRQVMDGDTIGEVLEWKHFGTQEHFDTAVRKFSLATVCGRGRPK